MKICIAGKNSIAKNACSWLLTEYGISKDDLLVCCNSNDKGLDGFQPSFRKYAEIGGLKIVTLEELYEISELYFFSLEFDSIISPEKFKSKYLFNIHFSLLPKYRGVYTAAWPILNGEDESGVTLHCIDNGIDSGDIISQKAFSIKGVTASQLYEKCMIEGAKLFQCELKNIVNGVFKKVSQDEDLASYYDRQSIDYSDISIDYNDKAEAIVRKIKAFSFPAFQLPKFESTEVFDATIDSFKSDDPGNDLKPGTKISESKTEILVKTKDFDVRLFKFVC